MLFRRLDIDKEWRSDVARDTDLLPLHGDPRWVVLTDSLHNRRESYENRFERPLRDKLKRILRDDQDIRQEYVSRQAKGASQHTLDSLMMRMHELDLVNEQKIADLLDKYGWLDGSRVGDMASVQFIVLQHAPLETQLKYRELLREGVERGDIAAAQYAMFEDRIAVRSGEKQRYGTQILFDAEGNPYVAPCVDEGQLEKWRSEVGLPPMNQYLKRWGLEWE